MKRELDRRKPAARDHAIRLAALILYGEPQVDEALSTSWRRALDQLKLSHIPDSQLCDHLRRHVPGAEGDELAAVSRVFETAPPWVLSFCCASLDRNILGIKIPDLSGVPNLGRLAVREALSAWPDLPKGTIDAGGPIPQPTVDESPNPLDALDEAEVIEYREIAAKLRNHGEEALSGRERRRFAALNAKADCRLWPDRNST
jgi:hypothetical protein